MGISFSLTPPAIPTLQEFIALAKRNGFARTDRFAVGFAPPMEAFEKKTKQEVWRESVQKIRKARLRGN